MWITTVEPVYDGHCVRQPPLQSSQPPLAPDSTKSLESVSVQQSPLYNGKLQQAHRQLSKPGFTVLAILYKSSAVQQ